jgi:hypothetical protein
LTSGIALTLVQRTDPANFMGISSRGPSLIRMTAPKALVVTAVVLAGLGALAAAYGALSAVDVLMHGYSAGFQEFYTVRPQGWLRHYYWSAAVADPGAAILLIGGAVLLVVRQRVGQVVLTAAGALVIVVGVFGAAVKPDLFGSGQAGAVDRVVYLAPLVFPVAVIALAWTPTVIRWFRSQ